jgi:tRNA-dihydrouridine synthase
MYAGEADWTLIGEVKNNPRMYIPVIGNGDVTDAQSCRQRFEETGVDAVMIGRGSIGCPWIFEDVRHYLDTGELISPKPFKQYLEILKDYVNRNIEHSGERGGIIHSRRHLAASPLFKGISDFRKTRVAMLRASTKEELFAIMDSVNSIRCLQDR